MNRHHVGRLGVRSSFRFSLAIVPLAVALATQAHAAGAPSATQLPTNGQVVAGQAALRSQGNTLTVTQASQRAVIDWQRFDLGSQARSRGALASVEWQFNLARQGHANTTLALFADAAALQQLKSANFAGAPEHNYMTLAGVGAWAEWRPRTEATLRLSIAQPIGNRPNATVQGRNQDGSRIGTRVWASAQWNF